jgi:hypothetical protein
LLSSLSYTIAQTEEASKDELQTIITVSSNLAKNAISLDILKEIDEEV